MKCLIFIPVISRTYCDQKSFAWEHEFKAFIEMASKDQFGLKVKLHNGNVANRVLPVQIHELEPYDRKLCESCLGSFLRGIEFIYKESGVERPLTAKDNEERNQNRTNYRNQINKVALAIRDIFSGQAFGTIRTGKCRTARHHQDAGKKQEKKFIRRFISYGHNYCRFPVCTETEQHDKSIAILPFVNLSNDPDQDYFCDGMMQGIAVIKK